LLSDSDLDVVVVAVEVMETDPELDNEGLREDEIVDEPDRVMDAETDVDGDEVADADAVEVSDTETDRVREAVPVPDKDVV
jgi:hypothetical protein